MKLKTKQKVFVSLAGRYWLFPRSWLGGKVVIAQNLQHVGPPIEGVVVHADGKWEIVSGTPMLSRSIEDVLVPLEELCGSLNAMEVVSVPATATKYVTDESRGM